MSTYALVTGSTGLIGSHVVRALEASGVKSSEIAKVGRDEFYGLPIILSDRKPEILFHCAGLTTGVHHSAVHPASLMREQIDLDLRVFEMSRAAGVKKIIALGCGCGYPASARQPYVEKDYCNGWPSEGHAHFGLAKQLLWALATAYHREHGILTHVGIPSNVYGPWDKFDEATSHVVASLIRKNYEAMKSGQPVVVWGDGKARRNFIHASDVAWAMVRLARMESAGPYLVNMPGEGLRSIRELAEEIQKHSSARILYDLSAPAGDAERDFARNSNIFGGSWPFVAFGEGIKRTWEWYCVEMKK